ncbi:MAG: circadian clock protein KaiC [Myxococcales bacterium]
MSRPAQNTAGGLAKTPTGIPGLDEITGGGLPAGRPTLVCGTAGCGKTLIAVEFLVRGATEFGEPGVFMAFEERAEDLRDNVKSLGFDLDRLVARRKLFIDHVSVERSEIEETGEYNLDGLFVRLAHAIDSVKAKRVVLDTIESLFSGFSNAAILRAELRRLFGWLKEKGVTAIITGERGEGQLTRQGLEEYVSDCVILLDQRVSDQIATRRMRIVKYRGSAHGTNEYPFLIDEHGISVLPITSLQLNHAVSTQKVSTGIPALDEMLGGGGVYAGSSVLISGPAGTGKTSTVMHMVQAACRRGERALVFAFEEAHAQIVRNARSVGVRLQESIDRGLLRIHASRPNAQGLEMHLLAVHRAVRQFKPKLVVLDPITNLISQGNADETNAMLVRLIDFLKAEGITGVYTSLTAPGISAEQTAVGVSSLIDTWILVNQVELNGERNRTLYVLKSRGMNHSNQVREFLLTSKGIRLRLPYLGDNGVLTGSARLAQEARDREADLARLEEAARQHELSTARRRSIEAQIEALKAELTGLSMQVDRAASAERARQERAASFQQALASSRRANGASR